MAYYKLEGENSTTLWNFQEGFTAKVVESAEGYLINLTDDKVEDVSLIADEMLEASYKDYIDDIAAFSRVGSHPPSAPPH